MTLTHLRQTVLATLAAAALCGVAGCHTDTSAADKAAIDASVQHFITSITAKDFDGIMQYYVPDQSLVVFDAIPPRQYVGAEAYRKDWEGFLGMYSGPIHASVSDWQTEVDGDIGFGHGFITITGSGKDGKSMDSTARVTDVYKKLDGKWLVVHEHVSYPVDPMTGKADLDSKP
jgi:ketosteroid isomerase-like protein